MELQGLMALLTKVLCGQYGWEMEELRLAGNGVDNAVFFLQEGERGKLAVRVPSVDKSREEWRWSLQKEHDLNVFCSSLGLPVPRVHLLHFGEELDFLVTEFIEGDGVPVPDTEIGAFAGRIHELQVDGLVISNQGNERMESYLARRIERRMAALKNLFPEDGFLLEKDKLQEVLSLNRSPHCLLHMDIRPVNLIGREGKAAAIFDWDNALIGPAALDIMRVLELGELDVGEFLRGYPNRDVLTGTPREVLALYRLDTALLMTDLFLYVLKDQAKGEFYAERVRLLRKEIQ
ncbi:phosphotransferase family protein [Peribacillus kribbensis]|uniref:phosphotransferase family protein n=1 Tax=Peribacillus kribbensis TaxID=356658 RepID=UPI00040BFFB4|nr:aminoglycoside phosphotransferase family protein [Peribacillus kribbensis]